jgi:glycosyltransferase involved in cell wall biosynthesis
MTAEWPATLPTSRMMPSVSVVTPTFNRRRFLPWLIECFKSQDYPLERIEWLFYDDGTDKILDVLTPHMKDLNIRYFSSEVKLNIGAKRNFLNVQARGEIIVTMDDDDYYPPERVRHAVGVLLGKKVEIVGSSANHMYYTDDGSIWQSGPYATNHATFGTMAYTKKFGISHLCDESVTFAEEVSFTKTYSEPLAQLDPLKVMLVIAHSENTFNKSKLRDSPSPVFRKTALKLRSFIRKADQRNFYATA